MRLPRFELVLLVLLAFLLPLGGDFAFAQQADAPAEEAENPAPDQDTEAAEDAAPDESPGQSALDQATQLRLTAQDARQVNRVIELLNEAIDKGLDDEGKQFATQMLTSALMERAEALSGAILDRPLPDPRQDPRWLQIRGVALLDLNKVVDLDESLHKAHFLIGRLHTLPMGDKNLARDSFTKVIQSEGVEDKMLAESHARRAGTFDDNDKVLADLNKAVELADDRIEYLLMRARHYNDVKEFDACLADIENVIKLDGKNYGTYELKGLVLQEQEKFDEALAAFNKATEISPSAITPYVRRSEMFALQDDLEKAIEQASKVVELEPQNPLGLLLRADLLLRDEQPKAALTDIDKANGVRPGLVQVFLLKARALEQLDRTSEALDQLEQLAGSINPEPRIYLQIGAMALGDEQPRRAIKALDRAIELDSENFFAHRLRGDAYLNIGEHKQAIENYEAAHKIEPDDAGVLNNLAWTLATSPTEEVRNGKRALELAERACELTDYEQAHIVSTLAAAHAELGDFDKAKEWAQKAVELEDGEDGEQIAQELQSYKDGKPWRESQMLNSGESEGDEPATTASNKPDEPVESKPAPARTIDF